MNIVKPAPDFQHLTKEQIFAALESTDATNPIAQEVARLIEGYSDNFAAHVAKIGYVPDDVFHITARTPIEAVAMQLATETIRAEIARNH